MAWLELAEHWAIALSGLLLLLSGMFELPMAARYRITAIPGFGLVGRLHHLAFRPLCGFGRLHRRRVVPSRLPRSCRERGLLPQKGDLKASIAVIKTFFGKGEEPPFEKYLPEQRLAYVGMAAIIAVLILSGLVKTYKNVFAPDMSHTLVLWATWLHNIFFVLFILAFVAHIGAILLKPNRPMVRGIFTGSVRLDYARHRHPLWLAGMDTAPFPPPVEAGEPMEPGEPGAGIADGLPVDAADEAPASPGAAAGTTEKPNT